MAIVGASRRHLCALVAVCALGLAAHARADSARAKPTVVFDPEGGFFVNRLPHGKAFLIEIAGSYDVRAVYLWAASECGGERRGKITTLSAAQRDETRVTTISVEQALKFDTSYCFAIEGGRPPSAEEKRRIERAFEAVLDAQLRDTSRSAADRGQIVAGVRVDGATGQPAACQAPPPLRVTPIAELLAGNRVAVTAVTEPLTGTAELGVWVVSAIPSAPFAEAPCAAPDGVTSSAVRLTLRPNT
jgi:hypothetical protein